MNQHIAGLADFLGSITNRAGEPLTEAARLWESERWLERNDPVLAKLLRAEAIAGRRAECNASDAANMPTIRDLLREAIAAHTGKPFRNPLFPERP